MRWSPELKQEVIAVLMQRLQVTNPVTGEKGMFGCPRCTFTGFDLIDGFIVQYVSPSTQHVLPERGITQMVTALPSVETMCQNCGCLTQHALGALGIDPMRKDETPKDESRLVTAGGVA